MDIIDDNLIKKNKEIVEEINKLKNEIQLLKDEHMGNNTAIGYESKKREYDDSNTNCNHITYNMIDDVVKSQYNWDAKDIPYNGVMPSNFRFPDNTLGRSLNKFFFTLVKNSSCQTNE